MKISAVNSLSYKYKQQNQGAKVQNQNIRNINQKKSNFYMHSYMPTFGNRIFQNFNADKLPNVGIDQEFSRTELVPESGSISLKSLFDMTSYLADEIRYFKKHGELIPYRQEEILESCKRKGLNEDDIKHSIEEETKAFAQKIEFLKDDVISTVNTLTPTEKEHTVYRTISKGWTKDHNDYFDWISKLKKGEEVVLDSSPIYISTSAKKTLGTYGGSKDYVLFDIKLPKGSKLVRLSSFDGIEQGIMKPEAKFRVIENEEYNNNFHYISLEYIPTEKG